MENAINFEIYSNVWHLGYQGFAMVSSDLFNRIIFGLLHLYYNNGMFATVQQN